MVALSRYWLVTVKNTNSKEGEFSSEGVGYKFVVTPALEPDMFEEAMKLELVKAIRAIKKEMIMKGMEP